MGIPNCVIPAHKLLGQAIEAEVAAHIEAHADLTDASGRRRIVRHGHMPEREVQADIGAVTVQSAKEIHRPRAGASVSRHRSCRLISRRDSRSRRFCPGDGNLKGISDRLFESPGGAAGINAPGLSQHHWSLKAVGWTIWKPGKSVFLSVRRYVYFSTSRLAWLTKMCFYRHIACCCCRPDGDVGKARGLVHAYPQVGDRPRWPRRRRLTVEGLRGYGPPVQRLGRSRSTCSPMPRSARRSRRSRIVLGPTPKPPSYFTAQNRHKAQSAWSRTVNAC